MDFGLVPLQPDNTRRISHSIFLVNMDEFTKWQWIILETLSLDLVIVCICSNYGFRLWVQYICDLGKWRHSEYFFHWISWLMADADQHQRSLYKQKSKDIKTQMRNNGKAVMRQPEPLPGRIRTIVYITVERKWTFASLTLRRYCNYITILLSWISITIYSDHVIISSFGKYTTNGHRSISQHGTVEWRCLGHYARAMVYCKKRQRSSPGFKNLLQILSNYTQWAHPINHLHTT